MYEAKRSREQGFKLGGFKVSDGKAGDLGSIWDSWAAGEGLRKGLKVVEIAHVVLNLACPYYLFAVCMCVVVKVLVPFWILIIVRHLYLGYSKRDQNFDNHPGVEAVQHWSYTQMWLRSFPLGAASHVGYGSKGCVPVESSSAVPDS